MDVIMVPSRIGHIGLLLPNLLASGPVNFGRKSRFDFSPKSDMLDQ